MAAFGCGTLLLTVEFSGRYASGGTTSPEDSPWLTYRSILLLILAAAARCG